MQFNFHLAAYQGLEKLAEGENELIVVSLERFKSRVAKKMVMRN